MSRKAQDRVERRHGIEAPIESEDELVQVRREVLLAHAVMSAEQPCFEVGEGEVDHGKVSVRLLWVPAEHCGFMRVPQARQRVVALPSIGAHHRPLRHVVLNECDEAVGVAPRNGPKTKAPRVGPSLERFAVGVVSPTSGGAVLTFTAATNLNNSHDGRLVVDATSFTLRPPTHKRLIYLNRILSPEGITLRAHHRRSQFVQHLERGLVPTDAKLALKLKSGLSGCLRRNKIRSPEPDRKRRVA